MKKMMMIGSLLLPMLTAGNWAQAHETHLAAHLAFKNETVHAHVSFVKEPVMGKGSEMLIETKDAATYQNIAIPDILSVKLYMPSMGHGSAPTKIAKALDASGNVLPGVYNVKNIYFIMNGDWDVNVSMTDENGVTETQKFSVSIE